MTIKPLTPQSCMDLPSPIEVLRKENDALRRENAELKKKASFRRDAEVLRLQLRCIQYRDYLQAEGIHFRPL